MSDIANTRKESTQEPEEISLRELVFKIQVWSKYLWSKKWVIILCGVVGGLLGMGYATYKRPVYHANTTFVLEDDGGSSLGQYAGMAAMVGMDIGGEKGLFRGDNIIELYKSRNMIERALLSVGTFEKGEERLIDRYLRFNRVRENWGSPDLKSLSFEGDKHSVLKDSVISVIVRDIRENYLTVGKPDKKLSIFKVEVKAKDEKFAQEFNKILVATVNSFYVYTKTKKNQENVNILQAQTDSVRAVMNGAIFNAAAAIDATPNLNPSMQRLRSTAQRTQFSAETNKAILTELVKNLELAKMTLRKEKPLIQVIDHPILPLEVSKLGKIKAAISGAFLMIMIVAVVIALRKGWLVLKQ